MGILLNIQSALDTKLNTLSPAVSTAWPNTKFNPTENTNWIRPTLLPARAVPVSLPGAIYHRGIYQIDIFVPLEKGVGALLTIADNIYTLFKGAELTKGSNKINIDAVGRGTTQRENAWLHGIIEIQYRCCDF